MLNFLGDGRAYFICAMLTELSIMRDMCDRKCRRGIRCCLLYPIFGACFSIYRKKFIRGMSPGIPDGVHLHMLVYRRLTRWAVGVKAARELTRRIR